MRATKDAGQRAGSLPMIGQTVSHYRILEKLGGGGMGTISQPAFFAEVALMLWLVIKGARPPALDAAASSLAAG